MYKRSLRKDSLIDAGRPYLSIYSGPGYIPEPGFKGSVGLGSASNSFWMDDKLRVNLGVKYSNVQDDYFAIGYEENSSIEKGE